MCPLYLQSLYPRRVSYSIDDLFPAADSAAVQVASAIRDLALALVAADASDDAMTAVASAVEVEVERLNKEPRRRLESLADREAAIRASARFNPVIGPGHPYAPPLRVSFEPDGTAIGSVEMTRISEGPPGAVHGGWVAMLLDQTLGHANSAAGIGAFTGELTVRYLKPTPYDVPLTITARVDSVDGRKVRTRGQIVANDGVTATADGLFIKWPELA
jgi:acyl-coenzyme A thioesterase PaaI-like protein